MEGKFANLFDEMAEELEDTRELFPGDSIPLSRHVKYGLDALNSGRAENYKEVMNLIDELVHRERMENEAKKATNLARQAASDAASAKYAAQRAESTANDVSRQVKGY